MDLLKLFLCSKSAGSKIFSTSSMSLFVSGFSISFIIPDLIELLIFSTFTISFLCSFSKNSLSTPLNLLINFCFSKTLFFFSSRILTQSSTSFLSLKNIILNLSLNISLFLGIYILIKAL